MSSESATNVLSASVRTGTGTGAARQLRRDGEIPAVIYSEGKPATALSVNRRNLQAFARVQSLRGGVVQLDIDGKSVRAVTREIQRHPVRDTVMHLDFQELKKGSSIVMTVNVEFVNHELSPGLKRGGVLNVVRHRVDLNCPADSIPSSIVVDLTGVELGDSLHIQSVTLPEGVTPTIDRDFTIATLAAPAVASEAGDDDSEGDAADEEGDS